MEKTKFIGLACLALFAMVALACGPELATPPPQQQQQTWYPTGGSGSSNTATDAGDNGGGGGGGDDEDDEGFGGGSGGGSGGGTGGGSGGGSGGGGGTSSTSCRSDFATGSTFNTGETILGACNAVPPTNCRTGTFIMMNDTNECFCAPHCTAFDPPRTPGQACNSTGTVVCQSLAPASGLKPANFCVPPDWNLCK